MTNIDNDETANLMAHLGAKEYFDVAPHSPHIVDIVSLDERYTMGMVHIECPEKEWALPQPKFPHHLKVLVSAENLIMPARETFLISIEDGRLRMRRDGEHSVSKP